MCEPLLHGDMRRRLVARLYRLPGGRRRVDRYPNATCPPIFSAAFRPFCAVFSPFFCGFRLPGAKTERTGARWRKMDEIWGRNGRETAVT